MRCTISDVYADQANPETNSSEQGSCQLFPFGNRDKAVRCLADFYDACGNSSRHRSRQTLKHEDPVLLVSPARSELNGAS
jgi:hypothetical protein